MIVKLDRVSESCDGRANFAADAAAFQRALAAAGLPAAHHLDLAEIRGLAGAADPSLLDPDNLPQSDPSKMNFGSGGNSDAKAWKDIWGCGQGIGAIKDVVPTADLVARLQEEYRGARARLLPN